MIVDLSLKVKNLDGLPVRQVNEDGEASELTLKTVMIEALLKPHTSDDTLTSEQKLSRFELARKLHLLSGEVDLELGDLEMVRKGLLSKNFPIMITGIACDMLEGKKGKE